MQTLPQITTSNQDMQLMQTKWASIINPVLKNTILDGVQLNNIVIAPGNNTINTTLGHPYQGWIVTDMQGAAVNLYSIPQANPSLNQLVLNSSNSATISLWVY